MPVDNIVVVVVFLWSEWSFNIIMPRRVATKLARRHVSDSWLISTVPHNTTTQKVCRLMIELATLQHGNMATWQHCNWAADSLMIQLNINAISHD